MSSITYILKKHFSKYFIVYILFGLVSWVIGDWIFESKIAPKEDERIGVFVVGEDVADDVFKDAILSSNPKILEASCYSYSPSESTIRLKFTTEGRSLSDIYILPYENDSFPVEKLVLEQSCLPLEGDIQSFLEEVIASPSFISFDGYQYAVKLGDFSNKRLGDCLKKNDFEYCLLINDSSVNFGEKSTYGLDVLRYLLEDKS